jgi:hypothetical protein
MWLRGCACGCVAQEHLTSPFPFPALYPVFPWGPAIDGSPLGLLDVPLNLLLSGQFNKVRHGRAAALQLLAVLVDACDSVHRVPCGCRCPRFSGRTRTRGRSSCR